jgi:hypothetical protein
MLVAVVVEPLTVEPLEQAGLAAVVTLVRLVATMSDKMELQTLVVVVEAAVMLVRS